MIVAIVKECFDDFSDANTCYCVFPLRWGCFPCWLLDRRQVVEGFMKSIGACKRCENCGAYSPNIRKDGYNKLFQVCKV